MKKRVSHNLILSGPSTIEHSRRVSISNSIIFEQDTLLSLSRRSHRVLFNEELGPVLPSSKTPQILPRLTALILVRFSKFFGGFGSSSVSQGTVIYTAQNRPYNGGSIRGSDALHVTVATSECICQFVSKSRPFCSQIPGHGRGPALMYSGAIR